MPAVPRQKWIKPYKNPIFWFSFRSPFNVGFLKYVYKTRECVLHFLVTKKKKKKKIKKKEKIFAFEEPDLQFKGKICPVILWRHKFTDLSSKALWRLIHSEERTSWQKSAFYYVIFFFFFFFFWKMRECAF